MTNFKGHFTTSIFLHAEEIKEVNTFKYLGSIIYGKDSKKASISRIAQTISVLTKLIMICNNRNIMLKYKIRLLNLIVS